MRTIALALFTWSFLSFGVVFISPANAATLEELNAAATEFKRNRMSADQLIAYCTRAAKDDAAPAEVQAAALVLRGQGRLAKKEFFLAADDARAALRVDPKHAPAHILLSSIAEANSRYDEAIAELYKAAKLTDNAFAKSTLHQKAEKLRERSGRMDSMRLGDL